MRVKPRSSRLVPFSTILRGECFRYGGCVYQKVERGEPLPRLADVGVELTAGIEHFFSSTTSVEPVAGTFVEE